MRLYASFSSPGLRNPGPVAPPDHLQLCVLSDPVQGWEVARLLTNTQIEDNAFALQVRVTTKALDGCAHARPGRRLLSIGAHASHAQIQLLHIEFVELLEQLRGAARIGRPLPSTSSSAQAHV